LELCVFMWLSHADCLLALSFGRTHHRLAHPNGQAAKACDAWSIALCILYMCLPRAARSLQGSVHMGHATSACLAMSSSWRAVSGAQMGAGCRAASARVARQVRKHSAREMLTTTPRNR
jgi:hypothetical protein